MLNQFTSYLEILAAIYTSMCIDKILKNLWSPQYYIDLNEALLEYQIEGRESLTKRIIETNKNKAESIQQYMQRRAAYLLVLCIWLILLCGYEGCFFDNKDSNSLNTVHNLMLLSVGFSFLLMFLGNKYFFSSNQRTTGAIIIIIFTISLILLLNYIKIIYIPNIPTNIIINIILYTMAIPILWQVFVCWMFTSAYKGYIKSKFSDENKRYNDVIKGIDEHNPNIIPYDYKKLFTDKIFHENKEKEEALKSSLDLYLENMEADIKKASNPHSVFIIFGAWLKYQIKKPINYIKSFFKNKRDFTLSQSN